MISDKKLQSWSKRGVPYYGNSLTDIGIFKALFRHLTGKKDASFQLHADRFTLGYLFLAAMIIRADRSKSELEIKYLNEFLEKHFGKKLAESGIHLLDAMLKTTFSWVDICDELKESVPYDGKLQLTYQLYGLATCDGKYHPMEHKHIQKICFRCGVDGDDRDQIAAMFNVSKENLRKRLEAKKQRRRARRRQYYRRGKYFTESRAYEVLGVQPSSSIQEIKSAYRKLVKKYHPDKAKVLGEQNKAIAKEMFLKVQKAYEKLQKRRGFN